MNARPLRIGIRAETANVEVQTGIERYAKQLILHLAALDPVNHYVLYLRRQPQPWLLELPENFSVRVVPAPFAWTTVRLAVELRRDRIDRFLALNYKAPVFKGRSSVVTIHDLAFLHYPELERWLYRWLLPLRIRAAARRARAVITVSRSTACDLVRLEPRLAGQVHIVPHGYERTSGADDARALPAEVPDRYVLYLSSVHPKKNVGRLIDAFVSLKRDLPHLPQQLVLAGQAGWNSEAILAQIAAHSDIVTYLGYVDDSTRSALYQHADLYVLPSLTEGFGLGVLEAFDAGTPVAVSRAMSLPEVAGDAAVYFDPLDIKDIAAAMGSVLTDEALRTQLISSGTARLADFSWERCARQTLEVLEL